MARLPLRPPGSVADEPLSFVEYSLMTPNARRQFTWNEIVEARKRVRRQQIETIASADRGSLARYGI